MNETKTELSREKIEQIKKSYASTERLTKVAKEFNITPKQARKILVDNGVKVRKIGCKATCTNCGSVFSNPDNSIMYCSHCGARIQSEKEKAEETISTALAMCGSIEAQTAWIYIKSLLEE